MYSRKNKHSNFLPLDLLNTFLPFLGIGFLRNHWHKVFPHFSATTSSSLNCNSIFEPNLHLQNYFIMPLNDNKCLSNFSCNLDISADHMISLFDIPQTGSNNLDDSLFDTSSQYINTSNIHDIAIIDNFTNEFLGMSVKMRSLVNRKVACDVTDFAPKKVDDQKL